MAKEAIIVEVVLLTVMVALFGLVLTVMLHLHRSIERRFDAVEAATERRFDAVEAATERRFDSVDAALVRLNTASGTHGERIARLEGRAESHAEAPA